MTEPLRAVILGAAALYGAVYAIWPERILKRKFEDEEVPKLSLRFARIAGIAMALLFGLWLAATLRG